MGDNIFSQLALLLFFSWVPGRRWGVENGAMKAKRDCMLTHQVRETHADVSEGKSITDTRKVNIWKSRQD